ncbi:MAG: DUF1385 domain-containing protein [Thermodesulfovibrionales bacterium]|nr:DUF1385 domain-containing protein [Thermodesulfovibrionales bacterium]
MFKKTIIFLNTWLLAADSEKRIQVGGQAVIEGVMMKAPEGWSVAVRDTEGKIRTKKEGLKKVKPFFRLPFIRGPVILFSTLRLGLKALEFSANIVAESSSEKKSGENSYKESQGEKKENSLSGFSMAITILSAFLIALGLFLLLPVYLTKLTGHLFKPVDENHLLFNLVDGVIRIIIFLLYILLVGLWKDMRRIFEYHGAEHKVIHAYEKGIPLEIDEIKKFSPCHPRCGTSFLMIVMLISILVFSFIPEDYSLFEKFISRLILIPFIAGLSYEVLKLSARYGNNIFIKSMVIPGLFLQKLTAREPDNSQIEVALVALEEALSFSNSLAINSKKF